jgi:outer membrane lipoprotein-sorting protein
VPARARRLLQFALPLLAWIVPPIAAHAQDAAAKLPEIDAILAMHVQARGGADRLKRIQAITMTGTMTGPTGAEVPTKIYMQRPDRIRQEIEVEGQALVQAFDGTRGWSLNPLSGQGPVEVPRAVAERMAAQADFDGPLVNTAAKGHRIEVVGVETVDGQQAARLKLTKKSGEVQHVWLDTERWLEVKSESTVEQAGRRVTIESRNSDFRTVDGVTSPFLVEVYAEGRLQQRIALESVEFPASLDAKLFSPPGR